MNYTLDDFPFEINVDGDYGENVILIQAPAWGGPITPETEAARIQGLKAAWTVGRRKFASEQLKLRRPTMPYAAHLSEDHKANIGKGMKGNQNKTGKPGRNQYTKDQS